jgi:hypothetical protein
VIALGNFDLVTGEHMVLWDLVVYICFPHGSINHPSSIRINHTNLPIMHEETRCSLTQYTAVYNKGQTDKEFELLSGKKKKKQDEDKLQCWEIESNNFPKVNL